MTSLYSNREPLPTCDHLSPEFLVKKWSHPITSEPAFLSEWGALENARSLSFDLGTYTGICVEPEASFCRSKSFSTCHFAGVRFVDDVEVLIGFEEEITMFSATVPSRALSGVLLEGDPLSIIDELHLYAMKTDIDSPTVPEDGLVGSPQFSSPEHGVIVCRLTDSWHQPIPEEMLPDQQEQDADPDVIPEPVHAHPIVHALLQVAEQQEAFDGLDGAMYVRTWFVHHVHLQSSPTSKILEFHEDWRRWVPDLLSSWREHIRPLEEVDFCVVTPDPYKGYLTQVVHADLIISQGRWTHRQPGLVTTHYQGRLAPPHTYAIAASFVHTISGFHIATAANAIDWCLSPQHRCSATYGWDVIPISQEPVHRMQRGHGFTLVVHNDFTAASSSNDFDQGGDSNAFAPERSDAGEEWNGNEAFDFAPNQGQSPRGSDPPQDQHPDDHEGPHDDSDASIHSADLGVLVYRLNAPEAHCFATWTTYASILDDLIHGLRLPRNQVRCFHRLAVAPIGVRVPSEEAVILQSVDDVTPGSEEKLILIDLVIHYQPLASGLLVPPAAQRQVWKVNPQIHRDQILLLLQLYAYCRDQGDRCLIHKNHALWAAADRTVHHIAHGDYVRVQVPPPQSSHVDTDIAIAFSCEESRDGVHLSMMQQTVRVLQEHTDFGQIQCKSDPSEQDDWSSIEPRFDRGRETTRTPYFLCQVHSGAPETTDWRG